MTYTQKERLIAGLMSIGWKRVESRSTKYVVLEKEGTEQKMYVGKSGALRSGKTVADSLPVLETGRSLVLKVGDKALSNPIPRSVA